jgi:hypothetical protein
MTVDIDKMWERHEYEIFHGRTSDPSQREEAKRCFFHGIQAGLRIVMLLKDTFDIADDEEKAKAEDAVFTRIEAIGDDIAQFILTTRPQQTPENDSP